MALLLRIQQFRAGRQLRKERVFLDRSNHLNIFNDEELIHRYRLPRRQIQELCNLLAGDLERATRRNHALTVEQQVLAALRFYASGSFQNVVGDVAGLSKASISRSVFRVSMALANRIQNYIHFPVNNLEIQRIKQGFYDIAGFPNILGCIDGTLIPIVAPSGINEHLYVCRKGFHAINVQLVTDADLRVLNVVCRYPGSTHDSFIWRNCELQDRFANNNMPNGWLLGDSGYPLTPHLLTPFINPANRNEERYNRKHKSTRCSIERANGVVKQRFRCLHKSGGCLMYSPQRCINIIISCLLLHNICIRDNVPMPDDDDDDDGDDDNDIDIPNDVNAEGRQVRDQLVIRFAQRNN